MTPYDRRRLAGPPRGDECEYCGEPQWRTELRLIHDVFGQPATLCCEGCFPASDTGPCFDDCPLPEDHRDDAGDLAVMRRREDA